MRKESKTIMFSQGNLRQFVVLSLIADSVAEADEIFVIQLTEAGGGIERHSETRAMVTISDTIPRYPAAAEGPTLAVGEFLG